MCACGAAMSEQQQPQQPFLSPASARLGLALNVGGMGLGRMGTRNGGVSWGVEV